MNSAFKTCAGLVSITAVRRILCFGLAFALGFGINITAFAEDTLEDSSYTAENTTNTEAEVTFSEESQNQETDSIQIEAAIQEEVTEEPFQRGYVNLKAETEVFGSPDSNDVIGRIGSSCYVFAETDETGWMKISFDTGESAEQERPIITAFVMETDVLFLDEAEELEVADSLADNSSLQMVGGYKIPQIEFAYDGEEESIEQEAASDGEDIEKEQNQADVESCPEESESPDDLVAEETETTSAFRQLFRQGKNPQNNESLFSLRAQVTSGPAVYFTRTGQRAISLHWDAVDSADYYEVFIREGETWRRKNKTVNTELSYNYLSLGQEYAYKVRAHLLIDGKGSYTDYSDVLSVTLDDLATTLHDQIVSRRSVLLSWDAVTDCDYYEIYRQIDNSGNWTRHKIVYGTETASLSINTGTEYQYKIRAHIKKEGQTFFGVFSDPLSVSYSIPVIQNVTDTTHGYTTFTLSWDKVKDSDYYEVYRKIGENGTWTRNLKTTESSAEYSLSRYRTYYFKVRAHIALPNDTFYTAYTDIVAVDTSIPSINTFMLENTNPQRYRLSWGEVDNADYYEIYRIMEKNGSWRRNLVIENATSREYSVSKGAFRGYKVRAHLIKDGQRVFTEFTVPRYAWNVDAPEIEVTETTSDQLTVQWLSVSQADKYYIYADGNKIDETSELQFSVDAAYIGSAISVSAVLCIDETEIETAQSKEVIYQPPVPVRYRALLIGETAYATRLNGPDNDVRFMNALLNGISNNYDVIAQQNATLNEIVDLIDIAFEGATENDVSLFYYSGHGVTGSPEYYSGALQTVDYQYITTMDLAELLSNVPGRVIVILDSCGSGAAISDGTENTMSILSGDNSVQRLDATGESEADGLLFDADQFNNGVIQAFSRFDSVIGTSSDSSSANEKTKAGELRQTKFYVITSSAYEENSLTTQVDGVWGGLLTRGIANGTGCSFPAGVYSGAMPADTNADNGISFFELASYCKQYTGDQQQVLSYSASPNYVIIQR